MGGRDEHRGPCHSKTVLQLESEELVGELALAVAVEVNSSQCVSSRNETAMGLAVLVRSRRCRDAVWYQCTESCVERMMSERQIRRDVWLRDCRGVRGEAEGLHEVAAFGQDVVYKFDAR
jgi:hypothetical protein